MITFDNLIMKIGIALLVTHEYLRTKEHNDSPYSQQEHMKSPHIALPINGRMMGSPLPA